MVEVIPGDEVNLQRIRKLLNDAYFTFDDLQDGIRVQENGVTTFVQIDAEKELVSLSSLWGFARHVSTVRRLEIVNSLNDSLILVRFSVTSQGNMWCDLQLPYANGLLTRSFVATLKRFASVSRGAVAMNSDDFE